MKKLIFALTLVSFGMTAFAHSHQAGNTVFENFTQTKKILEQKVYFDHRVTLYCGYKFDRQKRVSLPGSFRTPSHNPRMNRIEWEHVVPAENFGRTFSEWTRGDRACQGHKGAPFKGRKCAEAVSRDYRLMQSDMYNLYPAVGVVNQLRSNYRFVQLPAEAKSTFGSCQMKIARNQVEPPERSRGAIARTHLYMEATYPRFHMNPQQKRQMQAWDAQYPVDPWECLRAKRIEKLQGNENPFVKEACRRRHMW